jgi:hypothetical protein
MKMNRTTFIKVSVLLAIGTMLAAYVLNFKRAVRSILQKDSEKLSFREQDIIDRFMSDADREDYWRQFSTAKKMFICIEHFFYSFGIRAPYYSKYLQYRSQITGQFLLSTSLFTGVADVSEPLVYTRFFNQYKQPCSNPFSVNVYPERA